MNKRVKIINSMYEKIEKGTIGYLIDIFPNELYGCAVIFEEHKDKDNNCLVFWFKKDDLEIIEE